MNLEYQPIACSVYDVLEVAAMKKRRLTLTIAGKQQDIVAHDVYAKGKEEFLDGTDPAQSTLLHIRLDTIELVFDHFDKKTYAPKQC